MRLLIYACGLAAARPKKIKQELNKRSRRKNFVAIIFFAERSILYNMEQSVNGKAERKKIEAERRKSKVKNVAYTNGVKILCEIGVVFLLSTACVVLEILCVAFAENVFISKNENLFVVLSVLLTVGSFIAAALFSYFKKGVLYRTFVSLFVLTTFALLTLFILQKTGLFYVLGDEEAFSTYMRRAGTWMPLLYIAFQFLQVVILPVPAFVSTVAGVALFGPFKAALCSFVGIISGSLAAFFIGRKIGYRAVAWMVGEEALRKWLKKVKGKDYFLLTAMFVLPLFPDDILCFISGLSSMTWQYFVVMIVLARSIGIFATCYSVNFIPFNVWWGILIWCILIALLVAAFVVLYKNLDTLNEFFKSRFSREKKEKRRKNG